MLRFMGQGSHGPSPQDVKRDCIWLWPKRQEHADPNLFTFSPNASLRNVDMHLWEVAYENGGRMWALGDFFS